jgi:hypothetical protein
MNDISALIIENPWTNLPLCHEMTDTMAAHEPGFESSPDTKTAEYLDIDFQPQEL